MEQFENNLPIQEASSLDFIGSIPAVYESVLGDFIFEPYARDIITRITPTEHASVLELAAGTGRVTGFLAKLFSDKSTIVATDISDEMIEVGKQQVKSSNLTWHQVDIADIPFADNSFDLVVCQFGIMFLKDKIRGFSEIRRVLKPGGQFIFNVWAPLAENQIWQITNQVLMQFMGQLPALSHKVGPFSSSFVPTVQQQLQDAGFENCTVDTVKISSSISSAALAAKGFIHGLPIKELIGKNCPDKINEIEDKLSFEFAAHLGDFPLHTSFTAFVFSTIK
jgi:ubiquinone/menaquinone biosynthesis C-methylase UbiE